MSNTRNLTLKADGAGDQSTGTITFMEIQQ